MRNWKLVLNLKNNDAIFIEDSYNKLTYKLIYKFKNELESHPEFSLIMPGIEEIEKNDNINYFKKYIEVLKSFVAEKNKKTLIIDGKTFGLLLKVEKQLSFFKLLKNNNKQIVIIAEYDFLEDLKSYDNYKAIKLTIKNIEKSINVLDYFKEIKITIQKTHNPFKNPKMAYLKYIQEIQSTQD